MHGIYNYIPETNHVSTLYSAAAVVLLQFKVHVMLFPMLNVLYLHISTVPSHCVVPNLAVFCSVLI